MNDEKEIDIFDEDDVIVPLLESNFFELRCKDIKPLDIKKKSITIPMNINFVKKARILTGIHKGDILNIFKEDKEGIMVAVLNYFGREPFYLSYEPGEYEIIEENRS